MAFSIVCSSQCRQELCGQCRAARNWTGISVGEQKTCGAVCGGSASPQDSRPTTTASFTKTRNDTAERRKVSETESRGQQRVCQHQACEESARCAGSERRVVLWCQSCTQRTTTAVALGSVKEQAEVPIVSVDLAALQAQAAISPRLLITRVEEPSLLVTWVVARTPFLLICC